VAPRDALLARSDHQDGVAAPLAGAGAVSDAAIVRAVRLLRRRVGRGSAFDKWRRRTDGEPIPMVRSKEQATPSRGRESASDERSWCYASRRAPRTAAAARWDAERSCAGRVDQVTMIRAVDRPPEGVNLEVDTTVGEVTASARWRK